MVSDNQHSTKIVINYIPLVHSMTVSEYNVMMTCTCVGVGVLQCKYIGSSAGLCMCV